MKLTIICISCCFFTYSQSGEFAEPKEPAKRKKLSATARMKMISLNCEWNMCAAVYKKMERFISHVADHLAAETGMLIAQ